ncbi:MAG: KpsF/GutQ family sugar-phosphate isomerase [Prevotellaceae bacterium]|nr:KpsF/GutQ family sugar-phosphate isomerase [Prevotellaceae bacterium]
MTIREIAEQCLRDEAQTILDLIPYLDEQFDHAVELMLQCKGKVILTGVGKSGHVGAKIAATLSSTGTPAFFANPLDIYHGDLGVITPNDLVIAISHSGNTDDLLRFIPYLIEDKVPLIGMTSNTNSLLARYCTCHIYIRVSDEACPLNLAPTNSTTATLAMGDALACALIERRHFKASDFARFHPGGTLGKVLLTRAADVMRSDDLPVMPPSLPLGEVILRVSAGRLGLCVALDENERIIGIITDGDLRRAMQSLKDKFLTTPVSEAMSHNPKCVLPDTKITEIQDIMQRNKIHTVLVTNEDHHLLGVVDHFSCMF